MIPKSECLLQVLDIVKNLGQEKGKIITAQTLILTELDLDSLKMLELIEILKERFGVDFLSAPRSIADLYTVEAIVERLVVDNIVE